MRYEMGPKVCSSGWLNINDAVCFLRGVSINFITKNISNVF